jgi:hypothetical protein
MLLTRWRPQKMTKENPSPQLYTNTRFLKCLRLLTPFLFSHCLIRDCILLSVPVWMKSQSTEYAQSGNGRVLAGECGGCELQLRDKIHSPYFYFFTFNFADFSQSIAVSISAYRRPIKEPKKHYCCPISAIILLLLTSGLEAILYSSLQVMAIL